MFGFSPHAHTKRMRSMIGYMNQQFSLYDDLTVEENIKYTARAFRLEGDELRTNVEWALRAMDLLSVRREFAGVLSRGIKQRVALAAAISHRPRALLLDEPTAGTDPEARRRIWRLIRMLTEEGTTVLVTTHHLDEAEFCRRIGLLVDGTLIACGAPEDIKSSTNGYVLELHCKNLDEAIALAKDVVVPANMIRLPDRARFIIGNPQAESSLRAILATQADIILERAPISLEESFILRAQQARGTSTR